MKLYARKTIRDGVTSKELIWNCLGPGSSSVRLQGDFALGFEMYNTQRGILRGEIALFETAAVQGGGSEWNLVVDS